MAKSVSDLRKERLYCLMDFEGVNRAANIIEFRDEMRERGYCRVRLPDAVTPVVEAMNKGARAFFELPLEEKLSVGEMGQYAHKLAGYKCGTHREQLETHLECGNVTYPSPQNPPEFAEAMVKYFCLLETYAKFCLTLLVEGVGLRQEWFDALMDHDPIPEDDMSSSVLRICNYPSIEDCREDRCPEAAVDDVLCGEHTDIGLVTVDICAHVPGLQVQSTTGEWLDAETGESESKYLEAVVMPGDTLMRITNNYYKASVHRVMRPPSGSRIGMPFLLRGRPEAQLFTDDAKTPKTIDGALANFTAMTIKKLTGFASAKAIFSGWRLNRADLKNDS